jgi:hypothetical protein
MFADINVWGRNAGVVSVTMKRPRIKPQAKYRSTVLVILGGTD